MSEKKEQPEAVPQLNEGGISCCLSKAELDMGYIIRSGQKTTHAIEQLCEESELASKATLNNQYF